MTANQAIPDTVTHYHTISIDGFDIFYRKAGMRGKPVLLLLHGFPTSSHMFRNLIPLLAQQYYVIAPDYPGFGYIVRCLIAANSTTVSINLPI